MEREEKSAKLMGEHEQAIIDKDKEIGELQTQVKKLEVDIDNGESAREAQAIANSMNLDQQKYKLERDQATSKVEQMKSIQEIMKNQLEEA